jgi:hypothetical protein
MDVQVRYPAKAFNYSLGRIAVLRDASKEIMGIVKAVTQLLKDDWRASVYDRASSLITIKGP